MNGCGCVPIQLYLQKKKKKKRETSQIWPRRHSLLTSAIEGKVLQEQALAAMQYFSENMNYNGID
jgi:hypothetical protein